MGRLDTELLGLQIVARESASILGEVDGLIVDDSSLKIAGFLVDLGLFEARVLAFEEVLAIGDDAVIVEEAAAVRPITGEPRLENLARKEITVSFARAITKSGRDMGTVGDFLVDTETGDIVAIEVLPVIEDGGHIPETMMVAAGGVYKLGRDVVVLVEDVERHLMVQPATPLTPAEPTPAAEASVTPAPVPAEEPEDQLEDTVTDVPAPDLAAPSAADEVAAEDEATAEAATEAAPTAEAQPRHFLLGKRVLRRIEDPEGGLIAEAGDTVSYEMIQHAKASDQLLILSLNVE